MAMGDKLAGLAASLGKAGAVKHGVESLLKHLHKYFTRNASLALGALKGATELFFRKPVKIAELLLLIQSDGIIG